MKKTRIHPRGYIAVVSAAIISAILLAVVLAESTSVFWSRYDQLAYENYIRATLQAESCSYEAILKFTEDASSVTASTTISTPISIDGFSGNCIIQSVATTSTRITFSTSAVVGNSIAQIAAPQFTSTPP